jgi:hypothetical protein
LGSQDEHQIGMTRSSFALESFKNVQEIIRFIDAKAGAILVVYGIVLTVFLEFCSGLKFVNPNDIVGLRESIISIVTLIIGVIIVISLVYQLYYTIIQILNPKLASNYKEDERSIFYFWHIAEMKKNELLQRYQTATEEVIIEEIVGQLFEVSRILKIKTYRLKQAMRFLFIIILFTLLFIFLSALL